MMTNLKKNLGLPCVHVSKIYTEEVQISYGTIAVLFQLICQTSLVNI